MFKLLAGCFILLVCWSTQAINIDDFAKSTEYRQVQLSPDGKTLAVTLVVEEEPTLVFFETSSLEPIGRVNFPRAREPGDLFWVNNERVVFKLLHHLPWDESPKYFGQLYAVNYDGSKGELIYGYNAGQSQAGAKAKRRKKGIMGWADIIDLLPEDPNRILIQSTSQRRDNSAYPKALLLNVYAGIIDKHLQVSPVADANLYTDATGQVRLAVGSTKNNEKEVHVYNVEKKVWSELPVKEYGEGFSPITVSHDNNSFYVYDNNQTDQLGLYEINLETGKRTLIFNDQTVDLTEVLLTSDQKAILAIRFDPDYPNYAMFPSKSTEHQVFRNMLATFPEQKLRITSQTSDGSLSIIRVSGDKTPGTFYLYDKKSNKLRLLFKRLKHIDSSQLVPVSAISFKSRDGVELHGYLALPKSKQETNLPMVVIPHGGPHGVRDYWGYDSEVQALASQGFAVLQVNYRGSSGYGKKFRKAGFLQWGGIVQADIIDSVKWAIEEKIADENRICIMGGSFGAYSAVQSAILEPELFRCVVANAGIYDLEMLYEEGDIKNVYWGNAFLAEVIGKDRELLKEFSPVHHIKNLKADILIAHGEKDKRAPITHAEALKDALDKHNKSYEWIVKDREGHGFYSDKNQADYLRRVVAFLNKNLMFEPAK